MRFSAVRPHGQGPFVMRDRFFQPADVDEHDTEIAERLRVVGGERQRLLVARNGIFQMALLAQYDTEPDLALDAIWPKRDRALVTGYGRLELALRPQRAGEIVEDLDGIGPQSKSLAIGRDGLIEPAEILQRRAEVVVQFDGIVPEAQRPLEIADRPLRLAEILACIAEIVERVDRVWGEGERALVARHRFGEPSLSPENVAEIVVKSRIPAVSQNGLPNALDRDLGTPELMLDEAEQMKGMGMVGVDHKDITANPLSLRYSSCALIGERPVEPLGDRSACRAALLPLSFGAPLLSVHGT
jgi:hypothetical protein